MLLIAEINLKRVPTIKYLFRTFIYKWDGCRVDEEFDSPEKGCFVREI